MKKCKSQMRRTPRDGQLLVALRDAREVLEKAMKEIDFKYNSVATINLRIVLRFVLNDWRTFCIASGQTYDENAPYIKAARELENELNKI